MARAAPVSWPQRLALTGLAALLLAFYPLPPWLMPARPDWFTLLVIQWCLLLPGRFGIGWAWIIGFVVDGIEGGVLGKHAISMAVVAYLAIILRGRMLLYGNAQQMVIVFLLVSINQVLCQWVQNVTGHATVTLSFLLASVSSALLWPLLNATPENTKSMDG